MLGRLLSAFIVLLLGAVLVCVAIFAYVSLGAVMEHTALGSTLENRALAEVLSAKAAVSQAASDLRDAEARVAEARAAEERASGEADAERARAYGEKEILSAAAKSVEKDSRLVTWYAVRGDLRTLFMLLLLVPLEIGGGIAFGLWLIHKDQELRAARQQRHPTAAVAPE